MGKVFKKIYRVTRNIPFGQVSTYGRIAETVSSILHQKISAQMVGWALHANKDPETPCHRVVNRDGRLALNFAFDGWKEQKRRLLAEGIEFLDEMHVRINKKQIFSCQQDNGLV